MGNFILLKCKINNKLMCIGSICGLNIDENILVYEQLQKGVLEMGCETIILGGDWNCTWDTNIDVLDMAAIPSKLRSEKFKKNVRNTQNHRSVPGSLSEQTRIHLHTGRLTPHLSF